MTQTVALLDTLKKQLRTRGKTYAEAAAVLELSEASIKRLFSTRQFSLDRLARLCQWLDLEISDLVHLMEAQKMELDQLDEQQERELVSDPKLLVMSVSLLNRWRFEEVIETYDITETEGIRLLARLDRIGLIELLPGNRVRLRISRSFNWRSDGPIERFFEDRIQKDFFASRFKSPGETRTVLNGMLSTSSNAELQRRIERLAGEFDSLHHDDERRPIDERFGTSLVIAMRPWEPKAFQALRRQPAEKRFAD